LLPLLSDLLSRLGRVGPAWMEFRIDHLALVLEGPLGCCLCCEPLVILLQRMQMGERKKLCVCLLHIVLRDHILLAWPEMLPGPSFVVG